MEKRDIPFLSVGELSQLVEHRYVSPVQVVEAYLDRIDDLDFKFNSYLTLCRQEALSQAKEADREIAQGRYRGPMHGIPVGIKDQMWTAGIRSTGGSTFLTDFFPHEDATVVSRLKEAGAIILGKTNLTEFALSGFSHRFSIPRNPWNLDMFTGGSSSGSGAATAAFLCATSLGEDTGGSIRFPAAWCGLAGLVPTWGRVSRFGLMTACWSRDTVGPLSRTVKDAAVTLAAIAGQDPKDQYTWDVPVPDYSGGLNGDVKGVRVGVVDELMNSVLVEPETRLAADRAVAVLGELGTVVDSMSLPLAQQASSVSPALSGVEVESALNHHQWIRERPGDYGHDHRIALLAGSLIPAQAYYKAQKLRGLLRRQVLDSFEKYDVLVSPTIGVPAQPIENDPVVTSKESSSRHPYLLTQFANHAGCPAISVPCGLTSDGLPIGFQIVGRPWDEVTVLKVAYAYEQSTHWHAIRPPGI